MNYLVDLQTSKTKHCTARCRGNPSGTFPIPVWGWRGFQTGSGGVAEQTWPEGRGPGSMRLLFPPAAKSLPELPGAWGWPGDRWRLHLRGHSPDSAQPGPCRLWGTAGPEPGVILPALPRSPPTSLLLHLSPPHLALSAQPPAKLGAGAGGGKGRRANNKEATNFRKCFHHDPPLPPTSLPRFSVSPGIFQSAPR